MFLHSYSNESYNTDRSNNYVNYCKQQKTNEVNVCKFNHKNNNLSSKHTFITTYIEYENNV